jgi:transcriptional regulator with XRE-family HTH domain
MTLFAERLKAVRVGRKTLQKDIALALRLPLRTYQSYEYGEAEPDITTLIALADYFDVSLDYLCGRSDDPVRR